MNPIGGSGWIWVCDFLIYEDLLLGARVWIGFWMREVTALINWDKNLVQWKRWDRKWRKDNFMEKWVWGSWKWLNVETKYCRNGKWGTYDKLIQSMLKLTSYWSEEQTTNMFWIFRSIRKTPVSAFKYIFHLPVKVEHSFKESLALCNVNMWGKKNTLSSLN